MRFDLHIHTYEGSPDGRVPLVTLAQRLYEMNFNGMLVTDHNSFAAYDSQIMAVKALLPSFTVLRGVEYDTRDAGHMLAILPDGVTHPMLTIRGMKCERLIELVHSLGGILGPAHPYGNGFFAIMHTKWIKGKINALQPFDFIETNNACTLPQANERAKMLAVHFNKKQFGGSDAHRIEVAGSAWTDIDATIYNNNDFIKAVKGTVSFNPGGLFPQLYKFHGPVVKWLGITGYWMYNKCGVALNAHARHKLTKK